MNASEMTLDAFNADVARMAYIASAPVNADWRPYRGEYVVERGRFARAAYVVSTTPTRALVAIPQKGNGRVMLSWRGFDKLRAEEGRDLLNVRDAASALRAWLASDKGSDLAAELARVRADVAHLTTLTFRNHNAKRLGSRVKRCVSALRETRGYLARFTSEALPVLTLDLPVDPCEDKARAARTERTYTRAAELVPFLADAYDAAERQGNEPAACSRIARAYAASYLRATRERAKGRRRALRAMRRATFLPGATNAMGGPAFSYAGNR